MEFKVSLDEKEIKEAIRQYLVNKGYDTSVGMIFLNNHKNCERNMNSTYYSASAKIKKMKEE